MALLRLDERHVPCAVNLWFRLPFMANLAGNVRVLCGLAQVWGVYDHYARSRPGAVDVEVPWQLLRVNHYAARLVLNCILGFQVLRIIELVVSPGIRWGEDGFIAQGLQDAVASLLQVDIFAERCASRYLPCSSAHELHASRGLILAPPGVVKDLSLHGLFSDEWSSRWLQKGRLELQAGWRNRTPMYEPRSSPP